MYENLLWLLQLLAIAAGSILLVMSIGVLAIAIEKTYLVMMKSLNNIKQEGKSK